MKPGEVLLAEHRPEVVDEVLVSAGSAMKSEAHHLVLATPTPFGVAKTDIEQCEPEIPEAQLHRPSASRAEVDHRARSKPCRE